MYFKLFELNVGNINVVLQNNNDEGIKVSLYTTKVTRK